MTNGPLSTDILSVKVSCMNLEETMAEFCRWIDGHQKKRVCVTPVNCILWARRDERLRRIYNSSDLNTADGVPIIWASKLLGQAIRGRVTGLDLLPAFAKVASKKGYRFFFLGAQEGVAQQLADKLVSMYPGLQIAGTYSPPFEESFSADETARMISLINSSKANVLWVSLTAPKQDFWIHENFWKLNVNVAIGVGGAFEVTAGLIPRAPRWMQKFGLEWFFRFLQEPKRLFGRYFVEAPLFFPLVTLDVLRRRVFKRIQ